MFVLKDGACFTRDCPNPGRWIPITAVRYGDPLSQYRCTTCCDARFAVDLRQSIPGDCTPPDGREPRASTVDEAIMIFKEFAKAVGADRHGGAHAWIYYADSWDGISYGDSAEAYGYLEYDEKDRVHFESC